jgi:hypothetical protein
LESVSGTDLVLVNELYQTRFTVGSDELPFTHSLLSAVTVLSGPITAGANKVVSVPDAAIYTVGEFVEIREGASKDFTSVVARDTGIDTITLKLLGNSYTILAKIYQLDIRYDVVLVVDPDVACKEVTGISLLASIRDQMVIRKIWTDMTDNEFARLAAVLGVTVSGTRPNRVSQVYNALVAASGAKPRASGPGVFDQNIFQPDGGEFVSFSHASFDDQFESASGTATFEEYSFEVPFDCFLQRASIHTNSSTALDAYVTITKNDVTTIVAAGSPPPNRNLPAVSGETKGVDLANIPTAKGDKLTVRLNIVGANTLSRVKVSVGYAARLIPLP